MEPPPPSEQEARQPIREDTAGQAAPKPPALPHVPRMSWALQGAAVQATLTTQGPTEQPAGGLYEPGAGIDIIGDLSASAARGVCAKRLWAALHPRAAGGRWCLLARLWMQHAACSLAAAGPRPARCCRSSGGCWLGAVVPVPAAVLVSPLAAVCATPASARRTKSWRPACMLTAAAAAPAPPLPAPCLPGSCAHQLARAVARPRPAPHRGGP
jgi:hypothetical protein